MGTPQLTLHNPAHQALKKILPKLEGRYTDYISANDGDWREFLSRLEVRIEQLCSLLFELYGGRYDFFCYLESLLTALAEAWIARPADLKELDRLREREPDWFLSNQMFGGVCYVDLFAGDLSGLCSRIPYFKELGLTYLHLMPLFASPQPENDGGYAVSSYREVDPALGSMQQLSELASELRQNGISLVLDFVFNHTSNEHEWAKRALAGDPDFQEFYWMFPDRQMPDAYERNLREIFPDGHPGAFTYFPEIGRWVWTTFHSYQWDLNYQNPAVFVAMAQEMLALANQGVEFLRLDAVAFLWKRLGTSCENLPEAHRLIQAFNCIARIAAPALHFKSEAIVHPDEVARYISPQECQVSYNPLLMALLWESLATREVRLLAASLRERFAIPGGCAWVNYVRCHDDIGWTFSDEDAWRIGINGYDHRKFLNGFYTGRFPGSFARGLPFQENPRTGDCRISGTCASLAGLEKAILEETVVEVDLAIRRILLIYGIILMIGGIPLIYLGDEAGRLNDYAFRNDPAKAHDSRWVHRTKFDWEKIGKRTDRNETIGKIYAGLQRLILVRKANPVFTGCETQVIDSGNPHVLVLTHHHAGKQVMILANFSEREQMIQADLLRQLGHADALTDLISCDPVAIEDRNLEPYQFLCLV